MLTALTLSQTGAVWDEVDAEGRLDELEATALVDDQAFKQAQQVACALAALLQAGVSRVGANFAAIKRVAI